MYARRSGCFYPYDCSSASPNSIKQLLNPYSLQPSNTQYIKEESPLIQTRYFNSPVIQQLTFDTKDEKPVVCKVEPPDVTDTQVTYITAATATSATTKALNKMESVEPPKKFYRKGAKIPMRLKREKINQQLSKLLTPKSGLSLLNELKPGCVYKIQMQPGCLPPSFFVQVELGSSILGTGQGLSESQAKNNAAENAIKRIVSRAMSQQNQVTKPEVAASEDALENIPWAGLASFALYKMFTEWQNQGVDLSEIKPASKKKSKNKNVNKARQKKVLPPNAIDCHPTTVLNFMQNQSAIMWQNQGVDLSENKPASKKKTKNKNVNKARQKKVLPPNAIECHPTTVLNFMRPEITAVELERQDKPQYSVKVGLTVNGQMFTGIGGSKKGAKKEAAKAALLSLYGLTYPS